MSKLLRRPLYHLVAICLTASSCPIAIVDAEDRIVPVRLAQSTPNPAPQTPVPSQTVQSPSRIDQPQVPSKKSLAIPEHPNRRPPDKKKTRPKAAQPGRESSAHRPIDHRLGPSLPIPGKPSRNLAPPGGEEPTAEAEEPAGDDEADAEEAPDRPGLLCRLPHEFGNGITAEYIYTGGVFTNAHGGLSTRNATRYRGNLDVVMNFDTQGMGLWNGGRFFLYAQNVHGQTLTANHVGDFQLYDNLDGSPRPNDFTQVSEYWYQQNFQDDVWSVKVGKQDANANFAYTDLGGEFIHSSFGMVPVVPLTTFPNPGLGVATFFQPNRYFALGGGVYDGIFAGTNSTLGKVGLNGGLSLLQAQLTPQLGPNGQYPGTYRAGLFYHSGNWADVTGGPDVFTGNHGYWATADQMIFKEQLGNDDTQGLGVFFQYGWAPNDRNLIQEYYGGGLVYRGLLANRDEDVLGVGVANAKFSSLLRPDQTVETAIECFYKIRVSPWIVLQPAMFYIANPSGNGRDSLIPGGRFEIVF